MARSFKSPSRNPTLGYFSNLALGQAFSGQNRPDMVRVFGSFMFADLSGFTAMSDKLSASGRLGSEELTSIINDIFDPLLEIIFSSGGDVIKFGGDAVFVLFRGRNHTRKAYGCAASLLNWIGPSHNAITSVGEFPIAIHIGISRGKAVSAIIGKRGFRYDHLFCGPDASRSLAAADAASSGEIYVSRDCLPYIDPVTGNNNNDTEFIGVNIDSSTLRDRRARGRSGPKINPSRLKSFLAKGLWEKIKLSAKGRIDGEHRHITTVFAGIDGWHKNLSLARNVSDKFFAMVNRHIVSLYEITEKFGGNIVRLDLSGTGEKVLILFGAPVLREHAPFDALNAALEMKKVTEEISQSLPESLKIKIGVNSGASYVGDVGGSFRREYTAMGKEVNLAARLMNEASWGEIIAGQKTIDACEKYFTLEAKGTVPLKGVDNPVSLIAVLGRKRERLHRLAGTNLVGREKETEILKRFVSRVESGNGGILQIFGEAGSGKTSLMERVYREMEEKRIMVLHSACFQHASNTPLEPLGEILRNALCIPDDAGKDTRMVKLRSILERIESLEWEGLISRLIGYSLRPAPEIANLSETAQRDRTFQLIYSLIVALLDEGTACIILDDLHWSDATTIEFLKRFAGELSENKVGMLVISRFSEQVPRFEQAITIELGMLNERSSARLFRSVVRKEVSDDFVAEIVKASGGNPFYLEEMGKAVRDMGVRAWADFQGIPDGVERVITARIDCLDEKVRNTIRTASVIGRVFGLDDLTHIFPLETEKPKLPKYLKQSAKLDITPLEHTEPVIEYRFKHILTREVAYSGLSYKSRKMLHLALARHYRKSRQSRGMGTELIGYHYERSETPLVAVPFYLLSGISSAKTFSNSEAIFYFNKVLEMLPNEGYRRLRSRANIGLGRVFKLIGEYEKSEEHLRSAVELCRGCKIRHADALKELSELYRVRSEFDKSANALWELLKLDKDDPWLSAVYYNGMGENARRGGRLETALEHFSHSLEKGNKLEPGLRAQILNNMGICHWMMGRLHEALKSYNEAKSIYIQKRDLQGRAKISNNSGIILEQTGDLAAAAEAYREAGEVFEKIGDIRSHGFAMGNLATNFITRGLPFRAKEYIDKALKLFERIGDRESYSLTVGNLADWYYLIGNNDSAERVCEQSIHLARELSNDEQICEANIRRARLMSTTDTCGALRLIRQAIDEAAKKKWHDLQLRAELYLTEWEILNGDYSKWDSVMLDLIGLMGKEPPPELGYRIKKLRGLILYRSGDHKNARASFMEAYDIAAKSDLVCDLWEILNLFTLLFPDEKGAFDIKPKDLESRIFENLDRQTISHIGEKLKMWLNLYLSRVGSPIKGAPVTIG